MEHTLFAFPTLPPVILTILEKEILSSFSTKGNLGSEAAGHLSQSPSQRMAGLEAEPRTFCFQSLCSCPGDSPHGETEFGDDLEVKV